MLRSLIASSALRGSVRKTARLRELREYLCLRESLNPEAVRAGADKIGQLAQRYNISKDEVTELIKLLGYDTTRAANFLNAEAYASTVERWNYDLRTSSFYDGTQSTADTLRSLRTRFPEIANNRLISDERFQALRSLEQIFAREGPTLDQLNDPNVGQRYASEFQKRINEDLNALRQKYPQQKETLQRIEQVWAGFLQRFAGSASGTFGNILLFLDSYNQVLQAAGGQNKLVEYERRYKSLQVAIATPAESRNLISPVQKEVTTIAGETARTADLEARERQDIRVIGEEASAEAASQVIFNFLPWVDNKKIVYEAELSEILLRHIWLWAALLGVSAVNLLMLLGNGTGTWLELDLWTTTAAASAFALLANRNRRAIPLIRSIAVQRGGSQVEITVLNQGRTQTFSNVPVSSLRTGAHPADGLADGVSKFARGTTLTNTRPLAFGDNQVAYLSTRYRANNAALSSLLRGNNVDANLL